MSLFQNTVELKYLNQIDSNQLDSKFNEFKAYFGNPAIQENIRNSKEEQFQEGFLRELFVKILGYSLNPSANFNLTTEYKNIKDSKKADGAIIINDVVKAVIELKGTDTIDLVKIETQAFGYKNNQPDCVYVITSNFEKLRFYIDNAIEHIEFNLFTLTKQEFQLLYLCLSYTSIEKNIPKKIKDESVSKEDDITKKLYQDYSLFKRELHQNLVALNPQFDPLTLFKKSQKLLDRFLFLFFAEDRQLLPPNSVRLILEDWKDLQEKDEIIPLYNRFKKYFGYLNTGFKGKRYDVFAYNGGLFLPDEVLDSVKIDDTLLFNHTWKLSEYNFISEVDVNILGHIFENSLNELEEINAQLEGKEVDKSKTKRKKDGVFYTPKYITKYIVDNTVGRLCAEKKAELQINDEDYKSDKKRQTKTKQALVDKLKEYRNWLLQITICDPACGSGAFLNQALDFLINEHRYIDEFQAKLFGDSIVFTDIRKSILENNIFGVDINEESVEIAKLALWLRTAEPNRKLNDLNNNIKCGNSLIDDPAIASEKAFNWQNEFPDIFAKGGFDVVIGNPPYLRVQGLRENFEIESKFYEENYKSATGRFDVYVLFMEKSFELIKTQGKISFILPHKFLVSDFGVGIRKYFVDNKAVESILHFGSEMVFSVASTYTCIINLSKNNSSVRYKQISPLTLLMPFDFDLISYQVLSEAVWNLKSQESESIFTKLYAMPWTVKEVFENISQGIVSVGDDIFLLKGEVKGDYFKGYSEKISDYIIIEAATVKPLLKGEDVKKYAPLKHNYYCLFPHHELNGKTIPFDENYFKDNFPLAYNYILPFKEELIEKKIRYKTNPTAWYSLHRSREIALFEQIKIVTPETSLGGNMTIDLKGFYHNTQVYTLEKKLSIKEDNKFWLAILNSSLFWYFLQRTGAILRGGYFRFKTKYLESFPLPKLNDIEKQKPFIEKVDFMLSLNKELHEILQKFQRTIHRKFNIEDLSAKLQEWYLLSYSDFIKELGKKKIKLSLSDEAEWETYFIEEQKKALEIKTKIETTDKEIDQMVYKLYELTPEEVEIIESLN